MDEDLKQHLDAMEARLMERLAGRIDAVEDRIKDHISSADHELETKFITEFH